MEQYLIAMTCFGAIYALLALGLNFAWGLTGLINLGLAGFFALGAYASALATTVLGWPIALGIAFGFVVAAASGAVVTLATLRLRGDYLAIVTLGFAELVRLIATNETWLTRGSTNLLTVTGEALADLETVEKRYQKIEKAAKSGDPKSKAEFETLSKIRDALNNDKPARSETKAAVPQSKTELPVSVANARAQALADDEARNYAALDSTDVVNGMKLASADQANGSNTIPDNNTAATPPAASPLHLAPASAAGAWPPKHPP